MGVSPLEGKKAIPKDMAAFFSAMAESRSKMEEVAIVKVKQIFAPLEPLSTAATFLGLASIGLFQSNYHRISDLAHAALAHCNGARKIVKTEIVDCLNALSNSSSGWAEDPAEDVFAAPLYTSEGQFRILEGNWEGAKFFLERFIDILEKMPSTENFISTKKSAYSLLRISELIVSRLNVATNCILGTYPIREFCDSQIPEADYLRNLVKVTNENLDSIKVSLEDLMPFTFPMDERHLLPFPTHGNLTRLDTSPLLKDQFGNLYLHPQAVSPAVRTFIISNLSHSFQDKDFLIKALIHSYALTFQIHNLLGAIPFPGPSFFSKENSLDGVFFDGIFSVTPGRPLHLIFCFDNFEGDKKNWPAESFQIPQEQIVSLQKRIKSISDFCSEKTGFISGITLLVFAGWGRQVCFEIDRIKNPAWSFQSISAHDLCTLSDHPDFKPLVLWRIKEAELKFRELGGSMMNLSGFLNLFGWVLENNWHLVPHEQLPKDGSTDSFRLCLPNNLIGKVRRESIDTVDRMAVFDYSGKLVHLIRFQGRSYFSEDKGLPLYASLEALRRKELQVAFFEKNLEWWCFVRETSEAEPAFRIWEAAIHWLPNISKVLRQRGHSFEGKIIWELVFSVSNIHEKDKKEFFSKRIASNSIITTVHVFPQGVFERSDNLGEYSLIKSFLECLFPLVSTIEKNSILAEIFPNSDAKHCHFIPAKSYSDFLAEQLPPPVVLHPLDDSNMRFGLGWIQGETKKFIRIDGREHCVQRLNSIVDKIWVCLKEMLTHFSRKEFCVLLLNNLEAIRKEKKIWEKTIRACIALHKKKDNVLKTASEEIGKLTAASLASRLMVEMAVCECPINDGRLPDKMEISQLLGYSILLFHIGSWSDAINSELFPSTIEISLFGQIMMNYDFERKVIQPFQELFSKQQLTSEAEKYVKLFDKNEAEISNKNDFQKDFLECWAEEFFLSFESTRIFLNLIDEIGFQRKEPVFEIKFEEMLFKLSEKIPEEENRIKNFLIKLSLPVRERWNQAQKDLAAGFAINDWFPWSFRRKLSLVSRPILPVSNSENPILLVSPELVRESIGYLLHNMLTGSFDEKYFDSKQAKKWTGSQRSKLGIEFNKNVGKRMTELGWLTEIEVPVTKILNSKTDIDFGDIDVLAWSPDLKILLAIECKDLFFAKTTKEIGNQIREFKGKIVNGNERDRLRKHFDRLNIIKERISTVAKYIQSDEIEMFCGAVVFSQNNIMQFAPQMPRDKIVFCDIESLESPNRMKESLIPWLEDF